MKQSEKTKPEDGQKQSAAINPGESGMHPENSSQVDADQTLPVEQMKQMLTHLQRINLSSHLGIGLAHQVNHPLSASVNYIQCCIKKLEDDQFDRQEILSLMQQANQESYRAAELIARLRRFITQSVPRISTLNFNHKILEAVALLTPLVKEHDIELKLQLHEDLPVFHGDRIQIEQIFFNLGINAIQSLADSQAPEPQIIFKSDYDQEKKQLVCYISDNGPGIEPTFIPHLFEPFQTTRTHCLGLGLAMSKALCQLHHGQLTVENQKTGGCLAALHLPITRSESEYDHSTSERVK